jgi:hypothetical protein
MTGHGEIEQTSRDEKINEHEYEKNLKYGQIKEKKTQKTGENRIKRESVKTPT